MFAFLLPKSVDSEEGFTLIELLVVILIIGILTAVAIPVFLNQSKQASESSVKSDLKNAATVMETELASNKVYPQNLPESIQKSSGINLHLKGSSIPDGASGYVRPNGATRLNLQSTQANVPDSHIYLYLSSSGNITLENKGPQFAPQSTFYFRAKAICGSENGNVAATNVTLTYSSTTNNGVSLKSTCGTNPINDIIIEATPVDRAVGMAYIIPTETILAVSTNSEKPTKNQNFCIEAYHENNADNIWKYNSQNGGLAKGTC